LKNTLTFIFNQQMVLKEAELFSMTWNMVDAVLKQMSMRAFVDEIQTHLAKIF